MNKILTSIILALTLLLTINFASASYSSYYSGSQTSYREIPSYTQYPNYQTTTYSDSNSIKSNFDSSDYRYNYQGPLYIKTTTYDQYLKIRPSKTIVITSAKTTEKYLGSSESVYSNTQNRQLSKDSDVKSNSANYQGGFSWGKAIVFDSDSYQRDSYRSDYYYKPSYDYHSGYYNWNW